MVCGWVVGFYDVVSSAWRVCRGSRHDVCVMAVHVRSVGPPGCVFVLK